MNGSDYIIVGSTEENIVRIFSSKTGKFLRDVTFEGNREVDSNLTSST
jgi:hypothetical protein